MGERKREQLFKLNIVCNSRFNNLWDRGKGERERKLNNKEKDNQSEAVIPTNQKDITKE